MRLRDLRPKLEQAWGLDTTWCPESYDSMDGAWGQCGVTTMFLFKFMGYGMMSGIAVPTTRSPTRHFWNNHHGIDIDLTARQFPLGTVIIDPYEIDWSGISQGHWFIDRYNRFEEKVHVLLS